MNSVLDLFMGDPVYDEQKNIIRRDFGVKNMIIIGVCGWVVLGLMEGNGNNLKSGKGVMKGGGPLALMHGAANEITTFFTGDAWWQPGTPQPKTRGMSPIAVTLLFLLLALGGGIYLSTTSPGFWQRSGKGTIYHR